MRVGASTGCFYPEYTEKALERLGKLGIEVAEIFVNSQSELETPYINQINQIKKDYGIELSSFHPYMSFAEGFFIFCEYERRFHDGLEMYKKFFEAGAAMGAKYFVLHGAKKVQPIEKELYVQRYQKFCEVGKQCGIQVAHENVVHYKAESTYFMSYLKKNLGDEFKMVLDVKQARRAKVDPLKFVEQVGENIVHVHLSDCTQNSICAPISSEGLFDFKKLFNALDQKGYQGKYIVELYNQSFERDEQIRQSVDHVQSLLEK